MNHNTPWNTNHITYLIREGEKHTIEELMVEINKMGFPIALNYADVEEVLGKLDITPKPSPPTPPPPPIIIKPKIKVKSKKVAKKKRDYDGWKIHHIEYIKDNVDRLTVAELKVKLMVNLKFPKHLTLVGIRAKIAELGLTPLPDPPKPTPEQRKDSYAKKRLEDEVKQKREDTYEIIRTHYPYDGAEKCKAELAKVNIFMSKPKIYAMAKWLRVKRIRVEQGYQPNPLPPTHSLSPPHIGASYVVEDFNEEFGSNFSIFSKKEGGAEVLDSYVNQTSSLTLQLATKLLIAGYVVKKKEGAVLGVWGDVELL